MAREDRSGAGEEAGVVRRFLAGLADGDLDGSLSLVAPDLVFSEPPSLPFGGDWHGPAGLQAALAAVRRDYRVQLDPPVVHDLDDLVLVQVTGTITGRSTGRSAPLDALDLYRVAGGLVRRVDIYYREPAAVLALLEPEPTPIDAGGMP